MASNSEKFDQDVTAPRIKVGDLIWSRWHETNIWLGVICPDYGSNDQHTKAVKSGVFGSLTRRYYHVQCLGLRFEQAWISEYQLNLIKHEDVKEMARSINDCKMFFEKTNEERVEICSIRAKANQNPADVGNYTELLEAKVQNELLTNELRRLKESMKDEETTKNDLKQINESQNDIKKSMEDLMDIVMSQNQSANAGKEEEPNIESQFCFEQPLKKIKLEDQSEEIQRLNQIVKDLKDDNLKLSEKNTKILNDAEEMKKDLLKLARGVVELNLKEERLKLAKENVESKYGRGSKNGSF